LFSAKGMVFQIEKAKLGEKVGEEAELLVCLKNEMVRVLYGKHDHESKPCLKSQASTRNTTFFPQRREEIMGIECGERKNREMQRGLVCNYWG